MMRNKTGFTSVGIAVLAAFGSGCNGVPAEIMPLSEKVLVQEPMYENMTLGYWVRQLSSDDRVLRSKATMALGAFASNPELIEKIKPLILKAVNNTEDKKSKVDGYVALMELGYEKNLFQEIFEFYRSEKDGEIISYMFRGPVEVFKGSNDREFRNVNNRLKSTLISSLSRHFMKLIKVEDLYKLNSEEIHNYFQVIEKDIYAVEYRGMTGYEESEAYKHYRTPEFKSWLKQIIENTQDVNVKRRCLQRLQDGFGAADDLETTAYIIGQALKK